MPPTSGVVTLKNRRDVGSSLVLLFDRLALDAVLGQKGSRALGGLDRKAQCAKLLCHLQGPWRDSVAHAEQHRAFQG